MPDGSEDGQNYLLMAKALRNMRRKRGLCQQDLLDVPYPGNRVNGGRISEWETGVVPIPKEVFARFQEFFSTH